MIKLINKKVTITRGSNKGKSGVVFLEKGDRVFIKNINAYHQINKRKSKDRVRMTYIHRSNLSVNKTKLSKL